MLLDIFEELIHGIRTGELWYLEVSMILQIIFTLLSTYVSYKDYEDEDKRERYMLFSARMIILSISAVIISVIRSLIDTDIIVIVTAILIILVDIKLITNVENLPIWDERE